MRKVIFISDTHCGCRVGLCPPGVCLDGGGTYEPGIVQRAMWSWWRELWDEAVPRWAAGEPVAVVHNGDAIDGTHHGSTTQIAQNPADQEEIAYQVLAPLVDLARGAYYQVRGTEAHVGQSACDEERLARRLRAVPTPEGEASWWRLGVEIDGCLIDAMHHISTSGSTGSEALALNRELAESFAEAGRWHRRPVRMIVRSHRHTCAGVFLPAADGLAWSVTTPGWQGRTPYTAKIIGARQKQPQFGAVLVTVTDGQLDVLPWVRSIEPADPVRLGGDHE